eukprot:TRINITY_DN11690_c0_g2_i2.p1 TRINITY_DN11690_c0_g2~~TRINITY_DN11690_c0_g2_i2.p1  ORF type:complete len:961 (+),score=131.86 TRINITY_DN11690_c0_g2_i2:73-2883(+)
MVGSARGHDNLVVRFDALEASNQYLRDQMSKTFEIFARERHSSGVARQEFQERANHLRKWEGDFVTSLKIMEENNAHHLGESHARFVNFQEDHTRIMNEFKSRVDRCDEAASASLQNTAELKAGLEACEVKIWTACREYVAECLTEVSANVEDIHQKVSELQQDTAVDTVALRARLDVFIGDFDQKFAKLEARFEAHKAELYNERSCRLAQAETIRSHVDLSQTHLESNELRRHPAKELVAGTDAMTNEDDRGAEPADIECLAIRLASLEQKMALVSTAFAPQVEARTGGGQEEACGKGEIAEIRAAVAETCDSLVRLAKEVARIREERSSDKNSAIDLVGTVASAAASNIQRAEQTLEARRSDSDCSIREVQKQLVDLAFNVESVNQHLKMLEKGYRDLTNVARKNERSLEDSTRQLRAGIRTQVYRAGVDLETTLKQSIKASVIEDFTQHNTMIEKVLLRLGALERATMETTGKHELATQEMLELCKETALSTAAGVVRKTIDSEHTMFNVADLRSIVYNLSEDVTRLAREMDGCRASAVVAAAASDPARPKAYSDAALDKSCENGSNSQSLEAHGMSPRLDYIRRHCVAVSSSAHGVGEDVKLGTIGTARVNTMAEQSPGIQLPSVSDTLVHVEETVRPLASPSQTVRRVSHSSPRCGSTMTAALSAAASQQPWKFVPPNNDVGPTVSNSNLGDRTNLKSGRDSSHDKEGPLISPSPSNGEDDPGARSRTASSVASNFRPITNQVIKSERHDASADLVRITQREGIKSSCDLGSKRTLSSSPLRRSGTRYFDGGNLENDKSAACQFSPRIVYTSGPMTQNELQVRPGPVRIMSRPSAQSGARLYDMSTPRNRQASQTGVEQSQIGCTSREPKLSLPKPTSPSHTNGEWRESSSYDVAARQDAPKGGCLSARAGGQTLVPQSKVSGSVTAPAGR